MTLGSVFSSYHTEISLLLGPVLAFLTHRFVKLRTSFKIALLFLILLPIVGVLGVVLNVGLAIAIAIAFYWGPIPIWLGGLIAFDLFGLVNYAEMVWWQKFLIGGLWGLLSMLLAWAINFFLVYCFASSARNQFEENLP